MTDLSGQTIGPYRIISRLGRGGMADVYKAFHPGLAIHRAIKVIRPEFISERGFRDRFQREAQAVAQLRHPNIVLMHDFGVRNDLYYMVMEFIEGIDLKRYLEQRGRIRPIQEIVRTIDQIADALAYAHRRGVVHRDIKPANIMLTPEGEAILTDFGIVKMIQAGEGLTKTGTSIGTPAYMAPEQAQGMPDVGPAVDIYSLGIIVFEMLTGQAPFSADTPLAVLFKVISEPLPLPRNICRDIPESVQNVVLKATAKDPSVRYPSTKALSAALQASLAGEFQPAPPLDPTRPAVRSDRRRWVPWMWLGATGLLVALCLLTLLGGRALYSWASEQPFLFGSTETPVPSQEPAPVAVTTVPPERPTTIPRPAPFAEDQHGILLLGSEGSWELLVAAEGHLRAVLAETGVADQVEVALLIAEPGIDLPQVTTDQRGDLGVLVTLAGDADQVTVSAQAHTRNSLDKDMAAALDATADALLKTFQASSQPEAAALLADRLGAIVNAAIGYENRRDGEYDGCTRRFTAQLGLLKRIEVSYNRAEASYAYMGVCLSALGQDAAAKRNYEMALGINPDCSQAHFGLGNIWYTRGDYERAAESYRQALMASLVDPLSSDLTVARAHAGLGNIALVWGRYDEALEAFTDALEQEPDYPGYLMGRALAETELGLIQEARGDLEQCIELASTAEQVQSDHFRRLEQDCLTQLQELDSTPTFNAAVDQPSAALRSGPSPYHPTLRVLSQGEPLAVLSRSETNAWLQVETAQGERGWVLSGAVLPEMSLSEVPIAKVIPTPPAITLTTSPTPPPTLVPAPTQPPGATQPPPTQPPAATQPPPTQPAAPTPTQPPPTPAPTQPPPTPTLPPTPPPTPTAPPR